MPLDSAIVRKTVWSALAITLKKIPNDLMTVYFSGDINITEARVIQSEALSEATTTISEEEVENMYPNCPSEDPEYPGQDLPITSEIRDEVTTTNVSRIEDTVRRSNTTVNEVKLSAGVDYKVATASADITVTKTSEFEISTTEEVTKTIEQTKGYRDEFKYNVPYGYALRRKKNTSIETTSFPAMIKIIFDCDVDILIATNEFKNSDKVSRDGSAILFLGLDSGLHAAKPKILKFKGRLSDFIPADQRVVETILSFTTLTRREVIAHIPVKLKAGEGPCK